jgi:hypothetical protein
VERRSVRDVAQCCGVERDPFEEATEVGGGGSRRSVPGAGVA